MTGSRARRGHGSTPWWRRTTVFVCPSLTSNSAVRGDIGGTQQSGTAFELKIASLAKDAAVVEYARCAAEEILAADPSLTLPENALLARLKERYVNRGETDFGMIS